MWLGEVVSVPIGWLRGDERLEGRVGVAAGRTELAAGAQRQHHDVGRPGLAPKIEEAVLVP